MITVTAPVNAASRFAMAFWTSEWMVVNVRGWAGIVSTPCWTDGFRNPAFCTPIPTSALTPFIFGKSRMRKRARTDLCGGPSVMIVPTATTISSQNALTQEDDTSTPSWR